jgi:hypothetical protein
MRKRKYTRSYIPIGKMILTFIIVMGMAIVSGYGLTNYIIKPLIGMDKGGESIEEPTSLDFQGSSIIINNQEQKDVNIDLEEGNFHTLYSIQFGSFTDIAGANNMATVLASSDITTMVMEKDGAYKLVGPPFIKKDEATESLEEIRAVLGDDPFITSVEVRMK